MKYDIELYIANKLVEFSADPKILLNYKETSFHNPTIVKNSFSKQIEIEGTSRNNDIFGHIWNLDRYQYYGGDTGPAFNPIQKADFQLFVGGELFEKGYCKLNSITTSNNTIKYNITLYGGLGDFFYNLSYEGNTKKSLASLTYSTDDTAGPDLDFEINKDTVKEAWGQLTGTGDGIPREKWKVINFVPCYNGLPDDFDSQRVLINNNGLYGDIYKKSQTDGGTVYKPILNGQINDNGYSIGDLPEEMTEWETYDLRSYLQRPCISMKRIIDACCQPENNGGYKVELDSHFFNSQNPYYMDAWVTLPMLKSLEKKSTESETVTGATVSKSDGLWNVNFNTSQISSLNNIKMKAGVRFTPNASTQAQSLYSARHYYSRTTPTLQPWTFIKKWDFAAAITVQLQAFNSDGAVVAKSKAYMLGTEKFYPNSQHPLYMDFSDDPNEEYEYLSGYWKKSGSNYVFYDMSNNPVDLEFSFRGDVDYTSLKFKVLVATGSDVRYAFQGQPYYSSSNKLGDVSLYSSLNYNTTGNSRDSDVFALDRVQGSFYLNINELEAVANTYEGLFSNTQITKDMLLGGAGSGSGDGNGKTPADYLISFCKLFGLYFYCDSTELAENREKYPSGVIHIMDRDTFYTEEVVDLTKLIDYSRKLTITPATANAKWYRFDLGQVDSQAQNDYLKSYNYNYGRQIINTNYNFDSNTTDLYDGNAFIGGIMVREKDKYYKQPVQNIPNYTFNGVVYRLFNINGGEIETTEIEQEVAPTNAWSNINNLGLDYYDCFPKLQFHNTENSSSDGSDVLIFLNGTVATDGERGKTNYWLTDDVSDMVLLNEATACWILTSNEYNASNQRIAYRINYLPYFTRDIILGGQEGNIVHSWNFGHPQVTFVPNTYTTDGDSIYDKCWKDYVTDLYDVNSRILTCYVNVNMDGKPWPYWLRRFYWFQNAIWRLNAITDLNMATYDTTKMEFIKVQDINNYKLDQIRYFGTAYLSFDNNTIGYQGGTMTGKVHIQSGGHWAFADSFGWVDDNGNSQTYLTEDYVTPITGSGTETSFQITIPQNPGARRTWTLCFWYGDDVQYCGSFTQESNGTGSISITPTATTVSYSTTSTTLALAYNNISQSTLAVSVNGAWATASIDGNVIDVEFPVNTGDTRVATITVTGQDLLGNTRTATANVTQLVEPKYIRGWGDENDWVYTWSAPEGIDFDLSTNCRQVTITSSDANFSIYPTTAVNGDNVGINTVDSNLAGQDLIATITLTDVDGLAQQSFNVKQQYKPSLTLIAGDNPVESAGGVLQYRVRTEYIYAISGMPNWITVTDENGYTYTDGTKVNKPTNETIVLNVTVSDSSSLSARTSGSFSVVFYTDWGSQTDRIFFNITQKRYEPVIVPDVSAITLDYALMSQKNFNVISNVVRYNVTNSNSTNFNIAPTSGGNGTYSFTLGANQKNTSGADYTGTLTLHHTLGLADDKTISITQWFVPTFTGSTFVAPPTGGTLVFTANTHYPIAFTGVPTWITITNADTGDQYADSQVITPTGSSIVLNFAVRENWGYDDRATTNLAMVHYIDNQVQTEKRSILITQELEDYIDFLPYSSWTGISYLGATGVTLVEAGQDWFIASKPEWITTDVTSGGPSSWKSINFTADTNWSTARDGNVVVQLSGKTFSKPFYVSQEASPAKYIRVNPSAVTLEYLIADEAAFEVETNVQSFSIVGSDDTLVGCTPLTGTSGTTTVYASSLTKNTTHSDYENTLTIADGAGEVPDEAVYVTQRYMPWISGSTYVAKSSGDTLIFSAHSQYPIAFTGVPTWISSITNDDATITYQPDNVIDPEDIPTAFRFNVAPNWGTGARSATSMAMEIYDDLYAPMGDSVPMVITQDLYDFVDIIPSAWTGAPYSGGYQDVIISTTHNKNWDIRTKSSWIDVDPISGGSVGSAEITVQENTGSPRSGLVVFRVSGTTATTNFRVYQDAGPHFIVSPLTADAWCCGEELYISIRSDQPWTVQNLPYWVTADNTGGTGNATVILTVLPNDGIAQRTGTVDFDCPFKTETLTITQSEIPYFGVSPQIITAAKTGGTYQVNVTADTEWYVITGVDPEDPEGDWYELDVYEGSESGPVNITVNPYTGSSSRTATLYFEDVSGCNQVEITINQAG